MVKRRALLRQRRREGARESGDSSASGEDAQADADRLSELAKERIRALFPQLQASPVPVVPGSTGRIHLLMLKDGRPLDGAQIRFISEKRFKEPTPWDGVTASDYAYAGPPLYTQLWPHYDPVLDSARPIVGLLERVHGTTDQDGRLTMEIPAGRSLVLFVLHRDGGIPLVTQPHINMAMDGEVSITIEAARGRGVTGVCLDERGQALPGMWVQAIAPVEERPLSGSFISGPDGAFRLEVYGDDPTIRVRASVAHNIPLSRFYESEAEVPPIPAETTIEGVVPGTGKVEIRMPDAPLVFIELTVAANQPPLRHLQIEGLAFDPRAEAWGRLGGPQYQRPASEVGSRRAIIALPRSEAMRPLMLWSWGWTITAVDPRGKDRVSVTIQRGRKASVRGKGWKATDRLRVVCFCGPAGKELPCIWIEGPIGSKNQWSRNDSPISGIEFHIVRDGEIIGRSERVPPGTGAAREVRIDLE